MTDLAQRLLVGLLSVSLMTSVGMRLDVTGLRSAMRDTAFIARAIAFNFVVLPLVAWLCVRSLGLSHSLGLGLMLCAFGAGGCNSLIFIDKVDGDIAYGLLAIVLTGVIAAFVLPWLVASFATGADASDYASVLLAAGKAIVVFQVLPTLVGFAAKSVPKLGTPSVVKGLARVAEGSLWSLTALFVVFKGQNFGILGARGIGALVIVITSGLLLSLAPYPRSSSVGKSFVFSGLVRNIVVALLLNEWIVRDERTKSMILAYGFVMLVAAGVASLSFRRFALETE